MRSACVEDVVGGVGGVKDAIGGVGGVKDAFVDGAKESAA